MVGRFGHHGWQENQVSEFPASFDLFGRARKHSALHSQRLADPSDTDLVDLEGMSAEIGHLILLTDLFLGTFDFLVSIVVLDTQGIEAPVPEQ